MIIQYQDVFAGPNGELGLIDLVEHHIDTGDNKPVKLRPRRQALMNRKLVDQEVERMLKGGTIKPSESPWASPVVLISKRDKSTRFCVDYRRLNMATRKDAFPLPCIDDSLDALPGAGWFSTLDLASGYWQVQVAEEDRPKTAFYIRNGYAIWPFKCTSHL